MRQRLDMPTDTRPTPPSLALLELTEQIPEIRWQHGDDLCDCAFQRIGWWTNPYLGRTLEIRLCCAWKKLGELLPEVGQFIREIPAYEDPNTGRYHTAPAEWDGDYDMPRYLWYRHLAAKTGKPLGQIRREYDHLTPPRAVSRKSGSEGKTWQVAR